MRLPNTLATAALATLGWLGATAPAGAQGAPAPATTTSPAVGTLAPVFELPGATRYGSLAAPVRLADFRGQTVVIAFFYRARTKG